MNFHQIPIVNFKDLQWSLGDAMEGLTITGSTGTGKSTTSGNAILRAFLRLNMGGLVLTAKASDIDYWAKACEEEGRLNDLIIFGPDSGLFFDPVQYEWLAGGKNIESLIEVFDTLLSVGQKRAESGSDRFWDNATNENLRVCIRALDLAGEPISIANINRLFTSFPSKPGDFQTPEWQESYCSAALDLIRQRQATLSFEEWQDLEIITHHICLKWPELDPRTTSNILATWSGLASKFLFHPMSTIFNSGKCSFIPEMTTRQNKIIVIAFPLLRYNETGRLINDMMKLICQRAWLRRDVSVDPNPAFLWADEAQLFLLPKERDNAFQQVCRASRIATVYLTQNILNISEALGENHLGSKTKAFLANLVTKICHTQSCYDTNLYMSNLIGKEYKKLKSTNIGGGFSQGTQEHLMFRVEPDFFTSLAKPDSSNPIAETLVYQGGRRFGDQPFTIVQFSR